jgi:hypothetical protein
MSEPAASTSFGAQIRGNLVAIISLALALATLGYTTWRNETTEAHRNVRQAAFRTLEVLGELQVIVDGRRYQGDQLRGDYVAGWARVTLAGDLGGLLPSPAPESVASLRQVWQDNFEDWDSNTDPKAEQRISQAIAAARNSVLETLKALD